MNLACSLLMVWKGKLPERSSLSGSLQNVLRSLQQVRANGSLPAAQHQQQGQEVTGCPQCGGKLV